MGRKKGLGIYKLYKDDKPVKPLGYNFKMHPAQEKLVSDLFIYYDEVAEFTEGMWSKVSNRVIQMKQENGVWIKA